MMNLLQWSLLLKLLDIFDYNPEDAEDLTHKIDECLSSSGSIHEIAEQKGVEALEVQHEAEASSPKLKLKRSNYLTLRYDRSRDTRY